VPLKQGIGLESVDLQDTRELIVIEGGFAEKGKGARLAHVGIEIWVLATQFIFNVFRQFHGHGHLLILTQAEEFVHAGWIKPKVNQRKLKRDNLRNLDHCIDRLTEE
jgi:hypothetical protein